MHSVNEKVYFRPILLHGNAIDSYLDKQAAHSKPWLCLGLEAMLGVLGMLG